MTPAQADLQLKRFRPTLVASFLFAVALLPAAAVGAAEICTVVFRLTTAVTLTDIQFDATYTASPDARPTDAVDACQVLIPNAALAFNDDAESQILTLGLIRPQPFAGPTDVAACAFTYDVVPLIAENLAVNVTAADTLPEAGGAPTPVDPLPNVIVSDIACASVTTTTTSTTTTTTLDTTTTTTLPILGGTCLLTLSLEASQSLGALAFDIDYSPASMSFVTVPGGHHCVAAQSGNQISTSIDQSAGTLRVALVAGAATIDAPTGIAHCYLFYVGSPPTLEHFMTATVLALSLPGSAIDPTARPEVELAAIQCPAATATTTTLPTLPTLPTSTTTTTLPSAACAQPVSGNGKTTAADALYILRAMFGEAQCDLCVCDVNGSGMITVIDAQMALYLALDLPASPLCPVCG